MRKRKIKSDIKKIFRWFDENPGFENKKAYEVFPNISKSSIRTIKMKYLKYRKEGSWPELKENESIDTSISISKSNSDSNNDTSTNARNSQSLPDKNQKNKSINTSIDTFIMELFSQKETLLEILSGYQKTGSLPMEDIKLEKPFKTVSFNLMEKTISDFTMVCKDQGISQRKAVHMALKDFIKKYDSI